MKRDEPPEFDEIRIEYSTSDRFGDDQGGDPHQKHVQYVYGKVAGILWEEDGEDENATGTPLGTFSLAAIDLWEDGVRADDVLDSRSSEWVRYAGIVHEEDKVRHLLILDRIEIAPVARGYGIGLHVLARAIRTWGNEALVILTAFPPGGKGDEGRAGGEALARYWAQLGLERIEGDGDTPILLGRRWLVGENEVEDLCSWPLEVKR